MFIQVMDAITTSGRLKKFSHAGYDAWPWWWGGQAIDPYRLMGSGMPGQGFNRSGLKKSMISRECDSRSAAAPSGSSSAPSS